MPSNLEVFDITWVDVQPPEPGVTSITLPIGGEWQPNDWRIVVACGDLWEAFSVYTGFTPSPDFDSVWIPGIPPEGWSAIGIYDIDNSGDVGERLIAVARKLAVGDQDAEFSLIIPSGNPGAGKPNYNAWYNVAERPALFAFTVRGNDLGFVPSALALTGSSSSGSPPIVTTIASRSLPATPGFEIILWGTTFGVSGTPSGWTDIWNNGYCFDDVAYPSYIAKMMGVIGKKYTSGSTTGTTAITYQDGVTNSTTKPLFGDTAGVLSFPFRFYFKQAQDVAIAVNPGPAETYVSNAVTAAFGSSVIIPVNPGPAETYTAGQMFDPLTGYAVKDPDILPGTPVESSVVRWREIVQTGSRVAVETSLDWGRTWTVAVNGRPVPGLRPGDTTTDAVLVRARLDRDDVSIPKPKVYLDVDIKCDSGHDELVPLGTFLIKAADIEISPDTPSSGAGGGDTTGVVSSGGGQAGGGTSITLKGSDLSHAIAEHVWERPYFIVPSTRYDEALRQMVVDRLPGQTRFRIAATLQECPLLVYGTAPGADPWQDIRELALAVGWDAYFDPYGTFVARPVLDPSLAVPVCTFTELLGPPVTSIKRGLTRAEVFNWIIIDGEATSPQTGRPVVPVHAEAKNLDPNHPTFIGGKFGVKPYRLTLPAVTSDAQAQIAADALLLLLKEGAETVEITVPPNPALEPGDVISLDISDAQAAGNYVIHDMDTPSSAARGQRLTCYRQSRNLAAA